MPSSASLLLGDTTLFTMNSSMRFTAYWGALTGTLMYALLEKFIQTVRPFSSFQYTNHSFSAPNCSFSAGVKSFGILKNLRIISGVLPSIILATVLQYIRLRNQKNSQAVRDKREATKEY
uniref:Uncharacterized protein n=1 Tax=Glossina brevipalpis TaxID=37001 RepID=A0A1A9WZ43_9MUSC